MSFFPSVTIWRWLPTTERVINRGGARMRQTLMAPANFIFNPPQQSFPEKENIINFYSGCWSFFAKYSWGCSSKKLAAIMLTEETLWLWRSILILLFELMHRRHHRFFFRNWDSYCVSYPSCTIESPRLPKVSATCVQKKGSQRPSSSQLLITSQSARRICSTCWNVSCDIINLTERPLLNLPE